MTGVRSRMLVFLAVIFTLYLIVALTAFLSQKHLIYFPFATRVATPLDAGIAYEEIRLTADDGNQLLLWHLPQESARLIVVCFHGNADNISTNLDLYKTLHDLGAAVIAVEYRGYMQTDGQMSEQAIDRDIAALTQFLLRQISNDSVKIVGLGRSLGGAVAAKLAKSGVAAGLILESTFSSMTDVARKRFPFLPVAWLLTEKYDSESILRSVAVPVLVIHSPQDEVVPYSSARRLFDAASGPKTFVEIQGGHNSGVELSQTRIRAAYAAFFKSL